MLVALTLQDYHTYAYVVYRLYLLDTRWGIWRDNKGKKTIIITVLRKEFAFLTFILKKLGALEICQLLMLVALRLLDY